MSKRVLTLLLAVILAVSVPVNVRADEWLGELGRVSSYGTIDTTEPDGYGKIIYEHVDETQLITFKPTGVTVTAQKSSFVINANVTTASPLIAVQWSTDPKFKKDVHTKFFKNSGCKGKTYINVVRHYDKKAGTLTTWTRVIYQGQKKLDYRKVKLDDNHTLDTTQWLINRMRAKVALTKRLYVPNVVNPKRCYVRVRNCYDGQYSPWSVTVKVR